MQSIFEPGSDMMGTEFWLAAVDTLDAMQGGRPKGGNTTAVAIKCNPSQRR